MATYQKRFDGLGRTLGLGPLIVREIESKKPGRQAECAALLKATAGTEIIAFDETGEDLPSREYARLLAARRDDGVRELSLVIGGADGLTGEVRSAARNVLRLGRQTWPHMLVRAMLAEQLYRAATILADHPYHRD